MALTENMVRTALRDVYDPELGVNVVDLGLIYEVEINNDEGKIHVDMTLTSPGCPVGPMVIADIHRALSIFDDVKDVDVELVWSPYWNPSMMSEEAKEELGYYD